MNGPSSPSPARPPSSGCSTLKRVFYQAAFPSMRAVPESRAFYDRKRAEGKRHMQAVITLARRRVNVLWAMLRDGATFKVDPRLGIFIEIRHSERYTFSVASTERCRP